MSAGQPTPSRPRLGLALGGGAARGWAHIGVIEALAEAGIVPEVIAGCSIGAVVGGVHAAGRLDALKDFALSLTKRRVMGLLDLRLAGSGLIAGERLRKRLTQEFGTRRIEDLEIAFACIATECGSGHPVPLTRGPLIEALRASYALPGILPPVERGGRLLMDGTLVDPMPVGLARALGADVVACVSLAGDPRLRGPVAAPHAHLEDPLGTGPPGSGEDAEETEDAAESAAQCEAEGEAESAGAQIEQAVELRSRWALLRGAGLRLVERRAARTRAALRAATASGPGPARMMFDAFNIMQDRIAQGRLASEPPDVMITPQLAGMGLFEFHRAAEAIALGREAGRAALPEIFGRLEAVSAGA